MMSKSTINTQDKYPVVRNLIQPVEMLESVLHGNYHILMNSNLIKFSPLYFEILDIVAEFSAFS